MPVYRVEIPATIALCVEAPDDSRVEAATARFILDHLYDWAGGFDVKTCDSDGNKTLALVRVYPPMLRDDGTFQKDEEVVTITEEYQSWEDFNED